MRHLTRHIKGAGDGDRPLLHPRSVYVRAPARLRRASARLLLDRETRSVGQIGRALALCHSGSSTRPRSVKSTSCSRPRRRSSSTRTGSSSAAIAASTRGSNSQPRCSPRTPPVRRHPRRHDAASDRRAATRRGTTSRCWSSGWSGYRIQVEIEIPRRPVRAGRASPPPPRLDGSPEHRRAGTGRSDPGDQRGLQQRHRARLRRPRRHHRAPDRASSGFAGDHGRGFRRLAAAPTGIPTADAAS